MLRLNLFLACLIFFAQGIFAQQGAISQDYTNRLSGAAGELVVNGTVSLTYPPPMPGETGNRIRNIITLSLNEESATFLSDNFTASVNVAIYYGSSAPGADSVLQTLTVTYNKAGGVTYNPRNYLSFTGAQFVQVFVRSVTAPTLSNGVNTISVLSLQNEMQVWRTYALGSGSMLTPAITTTAPPATPVPDELPIGWQWPAGAGNTATVLEWTWLENELAGEYTQGGTLNTTLLFTHNATRVILPINVTSYNIPLFYDGAGTLYYRMRAVNFNSAGSEADGPWSAVETFAFGGHNNSLNWQVTTSYAEEGKRKTVMQYYDGSLRSRQTVTKDNTTNTTMTAETFYDGQGRAAVQVLPAPSMNTVVAYSQNLNLFNSQAQNSDPAAYFDLQPVAGPTTTPAMQTDTGAAHYYSSSNSEIASGNNQNIPDGGGYPYSVTWYTPDATNRVMAQSGVGPALKMGSNHETKYYYGSASQEELDGLFGTEAGDYTHYFKNMVQDANGQMSVNYVDMHNRTVATALAGSPTGGIQALNLAQYPGQAGTTITRNLLNGNSNTVRDGSIEALTTLLVPVTTAYQFNYALNPQSLQLSTCSKASICYDCQYNLQITITDESGNTPPIVREFDNVNLSADSNCATPVTPFEDDHYMGNVSSVSNNAISFSQTLLPGSYSVRKTLTVSQASLQTFQAKYALLAQCDSLQGLIDSVYNALLPTSNCNAAVTSTPCQSCMTSLGSYTTFKANYILTLNPSQQPTDSAIHAVYSADSASCAGLCTTSSHSLAAIQQLMLADMMPYSGQYAQSLQTAPNNLMTSRYNIFSTSGQGLTAQPYYLHPENSSGGAGFYVNSAGVVDPTIEPNGVLLSPLDTGTFAHLFASSWAQALLPHHPEYQQLLFAQQNLTASYNWIDNFSQITTFAGAVDSGYTNASGTSETLDPFFTLSGSNESDMTTLETTGAYYNNLSLWQMAYTSAVCNTQFADPADQSTCAQNAPLTPSSSAFTSLTTAQQNQVWNAFQGLYMNVRDSLVNAYISIKSPNADANTLAGLGYILRFPTNIIETIEQYQWTGLPTSVGGAPTANLTDSIFYMDTSRCGSYVSSWSAVLSQCPALLGRADSAAIIQQITGGMETVCEKGQNTANPWGASSVAPTTPQDGTPRSFSDVINAVFTAHGVAIGQFCNPFVISFPKAYGQNPVITPEVMTQVDSCACNQFAAIKSAATAAGFNPASLTSLNQYLNATYHDTLTQAVFTGLQSCSLLGTQSCYTTPNPFHVVTYPCSNPPSNPCGIVFKDAAAKKPASTITPLATAPTGTCSTTCDTTICEIISVIPLSGPQHKPAFLDCGFIGNPGCVTCAQLSALISSYKTYFAGQACDSAPLLNTTNLTPAEISYNVTFAQYVNYMTGLQLNWTDYVAAANAANCNLALYTSNGSATQTVVCPSTRALTDTGGLLVVDTPCARVHDMAVAIAQSIYQQRQAAALSNFASAYSSQCLSAASIEQFSVTYLTSEYHYTLYYYDQAGNMVKTVPPAGTRPNFTASFIAGVEAARLNGTVDTPLHVLVTSYRYNSLNEVIAQLTPDAGVSHFWYDLVGRLAVSQNAQQAHDGNYNYMVYDALSRTTEVGQKPQSSAMSQTISQNAASLSSWINTTGGTKNQITFTVYDLPATFILPQMMTQANLRNRISYTYTQPSATGSLYTGDFYTYDVHGNVDTLLLDYSGVGAMSTQPYKRICYNYDLISNKVNGVDYQPGAADAFYHRYQYDAENRVVQVLTSRDSITWEQDASYDFYKHGPVSRVVLGQLQTQQIDYSYTLQGWLKGFNIGGPFNGAADSVAAANAVTIDSTTHLVADSTGLSCPAGTAIANAVINSRPATGGPAQYTATNSITFENGFSTGNNDNMVALINSGLTVCTPPASPASTAATTGPDAPPVIPLSYPIAQDAYSYSLHYYAGDYTPISSASSVVDMLASNPAAAAPLFNGNIAAMAVNIPALTGSGPLVYNYHYDQLNRMVQMDAFSGWNAVNNTFTPVQLQDYHEQATYDPNGNITSYVRHGYSGGGIPMDSLTYTYYGGSNQLLRINDGAGGTYTMDLKDQGTGNNYTYDLNGELKQDLTNGVNAIDWTAFGKIDTIVNSSQTITYTYDATQNRITKFASDTTSVYVRDAQGNLMSLYRQSGSGAPQQTEVDLYGGSRLGIVRSLTVAPTSVALIGGFGTATLNTFTRGEKSFELTNHLDNVLETVTDKKIAVASTGNNALIDHYNADITTAQDYYPFGMLMPGRTFTASTAGNYHYGFNGKENDNEVKGTGNQIDYGMRIYDPRAGKFLSVDPLTQKYPWYTPYQFAGNKPIWANDLDGMEERFTTGVFKFVFGSPNGYAHPRTPLDYMSNAKLQTQRSVMDASLLWAPHVAYINTGGDELYSRQPSWDQLGSYTTQPTNVPSNMVNINLTPSAVQHNERINDLRKQFIVDDGVTGSENALINMLLGSYFKGNAPENIVFPTNGFGSNFLRNSPQVKEALTNFANKGQTVGKAATPFVGSSLVNMVTGFKLQDFVGSVDYTINNKNGTLTLTMTNVTSITSGTLGKEPLGWVGLSSWWPNGVTAGSQMGTNANSNFSQTFSLTFDLQEVIKEYKKAEVKKDKK